MVRSLLCYGIRDPAGSVQQRAELGVLRVQSILHYCACMTSAVCSVFSLRLPVSAMRGILGHILFWMQSRGSCSDEHAGQRCAVTAVCWQAQFSSAIGDPCAGPSNHGSFLCIAHDLILYPAVLGLRQLYSDWWVLGLLWKSLISWIASPGPYLLFTILSKPIVVQLAHVHQPIPLQQSLIALPSKILTAHEQVVEA